MTEESSTNPNANSSTAGISDIGIAYAAMLQRAENETQLRATYTGAFAQLGALLVGGSALPSLANSTDKTLTAIVGLGLPLLGIVATWAFSSIIQRVGRYHEYWMAWVRELEKLMDKRVAPIQKGRKLASGGRVKVGKQSFRFKWSERKPARWVLRAIYLGYSAIFIGLFVLNCFRIF